MKRCMFCEQPVQIVNGEWRHVGGDDAIKLMCSYRDRELPAENVEDAVTEGGD